MLAVILKTARTLIGDAQHVVLYKCRRLSPELSHHRDHHYRRLIVSSCSHVTHITQNLMIDVTYHSTIPEKEWYGIILFTYE